MSVQKTLKDRCIPRQSKKRYFNIKDVELHASNIYNRSSIIVFTISLWLAASEIEKKLV